MSTGHIRVQRSSNPSTSPHRRGALPTALRVHRHDSVRGVLRCLPGQTPRAGERHPLILFCLLSCFAPSVALVTPHPCSRPARRPVSGSLLTRGPTPLTTPGGHQGPPGNGCQPRSTPSRAVLVAPACVRDSSVEQELTPVRRVRSRVLDTTVRRVVTGHVRLDRR